MPDHIIALDFRGKVVLTKVNDEELKDFEERKNLFANVRTKDKDIKKLLKDPRIPKSWK